jgi:hypothetical protein
VIVSPVKHVFPLHAFHAEDDGDVGVIQRGEQLRFAFKARDPLRVAAEQVGEDFDGDLPVQVRVLSTIDFSHTSSAEFLDNSTVGDGLADSGHATLQTSSQIALRIDHAIIWGCGYVKKGKGTMLLHKLHWFLRLLQSLGHPPVDDEPFP